jgi:hypothetical protein
MKRDPTSIHIDNEDGDVVNQKGETERNLLADDKDHLKAPVKQKKRRKANPSNYKEIVPK